MKAWVRGFGNCCMSGIRLPFLGAVRRAIRFLLFDSARGTTKNMGLRLLPNRRNDENTLILRKSSTEENFSAMCCRNAWY